MRERLAHTPVGVRALDAQEPAARRAQPRGAALARGLVCATPIPRIVEQAIREAYAELAAQYTGDVDLAVRSSATCEDSEVASFAGQYESYLNVRGADGVADADLAGFAEALGLDAIHRAQGGLVEDMDRVADALYGRS